VAGKKARKARAVAKARPKAKARKNPKATTTQALPKTVVSQNRERHDRREGDERKRGSTQSIYEIVCPTVPTSSTATWIRLASASPSAVASFLLWKISPTRNSRKLRAISDELLHHPAGFAIADDRSGINSGQPG
jgi:hypothetical protein